MNQNNNSAIGFSRSSSSIGSAGNIVNEDEKDKSRFSIVPRSALYELKTNNRETESM